MIRLKPLAMIAFLAACMSLSGLIAYNAGRDRNAFPLEQWAVEVKSDPDPGPTIEFICQKENRDCFGWRWDTYRDCYLTQMAVVKFWAHQQQLFPSRAKQNISIECQREDRIPPEIRQRIGAIGKAQT
jgi:hypothetical protein